MSQNDKGKALYSGFRKEDCCNEDRLGVKKDMEEAADIGLSKASDLESRIKNLEAVFKFLKEVKEMKENSGTESCGSN
jgi:hypothetical protein